MDGFVPAVSSANMNIVANNGCIECNDQLQSYIL